MANEDHVGQGEPKADDPNETIDLFAVKRALQEVFYKKNNQDSVELSLDSSDGKSGNKIHK